MRCAAGGMKCVKARRSAWHLFAPVAPFGVLPSGRRLMNREACVCWMLSAVVACQPWAALGETPGEIPKPWTYEGSMKLQEQQRQQDQQYQQQQQSPQGGGRVAPGGGGGGAAAA